VPTSSKRGSAQLALCWPRSWAVRRRQALLANYHKSPPASPRAVRGRPRPSAAAPPRQTLTPAAAGPYASRKATTDAGTRIAMRREQRAIRLFTPSLRPRLQHQRPAGRRRQATEGPRRAAAPGVLMHPSPGGSADTPAALGTLAAAPPPLPLQDLCRVRCRDLASSRQASFGPPLRCC